MYIYPPKRNVDVLLNVGLIIKVLVSNALLLLVNPFGTSMWTRMDVELDKREARKFLFFERYSLVILRISMYGEIHKIKLGTTLFPNWRHILSHNK